MKASYEKLVVAAAVSEDDFDLDIHVVSSQAGSQLALTNGVAGASAGAIPSAAGKAQSSKPTSKNKQTGSTMSGCDVIDKAIGPRITDPIAAACKARTATLRPFNNILTKITSAKETCLSVLGKKHEEVGIPSLHSGEEDRPLPLASGN